MSKDLLRLARRALETLPADDLQGSNVYLDSHVHPAGTPVPVGRQTVIVGEPSLLLFVDLMPAANWGHPSKYLLVGTENENVQVIDAQFPPRREPLRLLRRGEGAEEWTLLTRAGVEESGPQ
jgi:hypothetical protein